MNTPELTLTQRALRPVINRLVEGWFPNECFYGNSFLDAFKELDRGEGVTGKTAAMYLQSIMREARADTITYEMIEVTERDVSVGSYKLTLEKLKTTNP